MIEKSSNKKQRKQKVPKKITDTYLHNAGLFYLQRFTASRSHFYDVMMRKIKKSCTYHKNQKIEDCESLLKNLIEKFEELGLLDDKSYAKAYIRSLRMKGFSAQKILYQCRVKGLSNTLSKDTLDSIDQIESNESNINPDTLAAQRFAKKKRIGPFRTKEKTPDLIRRELSALARAGFSYDIAKKTIECESDEIEDFML